MKPARTESTARSRSVKIVIVDDHPIVRERLAEVIRAEPDLVVCGEADSRSQAVAVIEDTAPDLLIVDLTLKDSSGLELIKDVQARAPRTMVLVVSMHDEALFAERCLRAGARGYLTKQEASRKVLTAIRKVLAGEVYLSEAIAQKVLGQVAGRPTPGEVRPLATLSDRELEVLGLLGHGLSTRQIAERLHLDSKTVETYRMRIKLKLGLDDANALLQYAIQWVRSS